MVNFTLNSRSYEATEMSAAAFADAVAKAVGKKATRQLVAMIATGLARAKDKLVLTLPKVDVLLGLTEESQLELVPTAPKAPTGREPGADAQLLIALQTSATRDHLMSRLKRTGETFKGGGVPFAAQRRYYLSSAFPNLAGHHLIKGYGMHVAKPQAEPEAVPGLRLLHEHASTYLRDAPGDATKLYDEVLARDPTGPKNATKLLVNTALAAEKLKSLGVSEGYDVSMGAEIAPGMHVLLVRPNSKFMQMMRTTGVVPSSYAAARLLAGDVTVSPDPSLDNNGTLTEIKEGSALKKLKSATGDTHALQAAHALVSALDVSNANQDPLVGEALRGVSIMVQAMAAQADDPTKVAQSFSFLIEELHIILARTRPFSGEALTNLQRSIFDARCPKLKALAQGVHLVSNGMDALSSAIYVAQFVHKKKQLTAFEERLNYFEVVDLMKHGKLGSDFGPIMTAPLNPSMPGRPMDQAALGKAVLERFSQEQRVTLVLDATIERDEGDLARFLEPLHERIAKGDLNVIVCKSYQKYATLGSGKIMAGSVVMLNNGTAPWDGANSKMAALTPKLAGHDEMQLLGHILKHASQHELLLIQDSADKAQVLGAHVWPTTRNEPPVQGLPFVSVPAMLFGDTTLSTDVMRALDIEARDSFGFMRTSFLLAGDITRVTAGHEHIETLVERLFAAGHIALADGTPDDTTKHLVALQLLGANPEESQEEVKKFGKHRDALMLLGGDKAVDPSKALEFVLKYKNNIEASYHYAVRLRPARAQADHEALAKFLEDGLKGVTHETREALFGDWFKGLTTKNPIDLPRLRKFADDIPPLNRLDFLKSVEWRHIAANAHDVFALLTADMQAEELFEMLDQLIAAKAVEKAQTLYDILAAQGPDFVIDKGLHELDVTSPDLSVGDYSNPLRSAEKAIAQLSSM
jgi:hypothetical protein